MSEAVESYHKLDEFEIIGVDENSSDTFVRKGISFWKDVKRRLLQNKVAMIGLIVVAAMIVMAIIGPFMTPFRYDETNLENINAGISFKHWFGTDTLGRDLWARAWIGARVSLTVGILGAVMPSVIGIVIGGISGYFGGIADMVIMRFIDICTCIPNMIYVILLMIYLGSGVSTIIIAFAIIAWMGPARTVRGLTLQLKEREFVLAARTLGASPARLIFKHLIPNTLGIVIVNITTLVPSAIFVEAYLSFMGLGVKPPLPSWGQLSSEGNLVLTVYPMQLFIPAMLISVTMLAFNLLGDGLRDAIDPKLRD